MSSLSASSEVFSKPGAGKTPPPAASALYAKRARERELQDERLNTARYRPPALRTITSGDSPPPSAESAASSTIDSLPPTNFPTGFRRARAGTLPSNMQLAAQRYGSPFGQTQPQPSELTPVEQFGLSGLDVRLQPSLTPTSAIVPSANPQRPTLKHAASLASSAVMSERNSRLRSGSLTLPSDGLSNTPFGPSLFSSAWSNNNQRHAGFPALDEMRPSATEVHDEFDVDVHTLDYLGLDDNGRSAQAPTSVSELRVRSRVAQPSTGLAPNMSRLRATTVSGPYRLPSGLPGDDDDDEYFMNEYNELPTTNSLRTPIESYGGNEFGEDPIAQRYRESQLASSSISTNGRARAISMGNLDEQTRKMSGRHPYDPDTPTYESELGPGLYGPNSILKDGRVRAGSMATPPSVRFPPSESNRGLGFGVTSIRSVSPKQEPSAQTQTPSRSLWIGNLDSSFTSEDLIRVFAPYGAIESLRLLPEKECGFVNFVDQADAIRAKDDVLNRLGGMIGMANGQAVRVGFGKPDSAPVAPAKGTAVVTPQGIATPGGATHLKSPSTTNSPGGLDQVQSTPTRALWIGSIPSTTTPAAILSVFSPFGPIESARVLTHKNCGFINFERLDDAVRARKALNGRDVLGSDVGAIRIGFARVPTRGSAGEPGVLEESASNSVQGIGDMTVGASIHALRNVKGASTISADQQVLSGNVENYRSNLLLNMLAGGLEPVSETPTIPVTEQQMIMIALSAGSPDAEPDIQALAEFRPPTMYYTTIPLVGDRSQSKRWDAGKLRDLRKRLDSGNMSMQDVDEVASDFLDAEIVDLAADWLGNTVVQKLFERCSQPLRLAMLERLAPHLAMIGIHKNGTWAAQKIIDCVSTPEEIALVTQHLRAYTPPLLLDQFGNYVVQCCLRFGPPDNDFVFDSIVDRLWEVAQGRFGARSVRACLESNHITVSQQRRLATAIILNSIPLATNPNGALLLTWLLDTSNFPARYTLLAPRFTPHLSHLCTHKLASLTVLRLVNQKVEPAASALVIEGLFSSPNDQVLTDVLGDQVNGVSVVHKMLTSPFLSPEQREGCIEATKRVLIELKVIATQAYRRLIEEVGLPVPNFTGSYSASPIASQEYGSTRGGSGYPTSQSPNANELAPLMGNMHLQQGMGGGGANFATPVPYHPHPQRTHNFPPDFTDQAPRNRNAGSFSPGMDPFNPFALRSPELSPIARHAPLENYPPGSLSPPPGPYPNQAPSLAQAGNLLGMSQPNYSMPPPLPPHVYQAYYQMYQQQNPQNMGAFQ